MEATSNQDNDYIIIPNPIYDVVFRYLMADYESAVIVLSTLINEKILQLHLEPLTHPIKAGTVKDPRTDEDVSLFHLDFTATIQLEDGTEELIMIELQKAAEPTDIFRFKRYISKNFQHKRLEEITHHKSQAITVVERPIRLIPIFILNFRIENEINDLLIKVNRSKLGVFKNEILQKHNDFIDNLSYDMLVVQLPNLRNIREEEYQQDDYKQKLFSLLKLFDQRERFKNNEHRLRVMRKLLPGFLERVVARLQAADKDNPDLEESMLAEDEILKLLLARDNEIALVKGQLDQTKAELGNTKAELGNTKAELGNTKAELGNTKAELGNTKAELGNTKAELDKKNELLITAAKKLKSSGTPDEEIAALFGLSLAQIKAL